MVLKRIKILVVFLVLLLVSNGRIIAFVDDDGSYVSIGYESIEDYSNHYLQEWKK